MPVGFVSLGELEDSNPGKPWSMDRKRNYTKRFRVIIDDKALANAASICQCPGLPILGSFYYTPLLNYYDTFALMSETSADVEEKKDWQSWIVTVNYTTEMPKGGPRKKENKDQPDQDPPSVHWETETVQKALPYDLNARSWSNSAFCPYKPSPTIELVRPVLIITRNELTFGPGKIDKWARKSNSIDFLGRPQGCARCDPPTGEQVYHGGLLFYRITYRIKFGARLAIPSNIQVRGYPLPDFPGAPLGAFGIFNDTIVFERLDVEDLLDEGYMQLEVAGPLTGQPCNIKRNGSNITIPALLNGHGRAISIVGDGPNQKEVYNRFQITSYNDLNTLISSGNIVP